jgi:hypothetical protein
MVTRGSRLVHSTPEYAKYYDSLPREDKRRRWIDNMEKILQENPFAGDRIQKALFPREYRIRYNVFFVYRFRHPEGYRTIYSLVVEKDGTATPVLLEFLTHTEYERRFRYRPT